MSKTFKDKFKSNKEKKIKSTKNPNKNLRTRDLIKLADQEIEENR